MIKRSADIMLNVKDNVQIHIDKISDKCLSLNFLRVFGWTACKHT